MAIRRPSRDERDLGYSIGGPVGKPGGNNKLFFFYSQEFAAPHRRATTSRVPHADGARADGRLLADDDNNGNPYPYIKDPLMIGDLQRAEQAACFRDGGVLGPHPGQSPVSTGLAVLNMWPLPNITRPPVSPTTTN